MTKRSDREHPLPRLPGVIKARRLELGISQHHIGNQIGVSQTAVARWENGRRVPAGDHLLILLRLLRITFDEVSGPVA